MKMKDKIILDACCGPRMMWFNKHHPSAIYMDIRREEFIACDGRHINVDPDLMPHQIRITSIRAEQLQDISDEDCLREGIYIDGGDDSYVPHYFYDYPNNPLNGFDTPREAFAFLIDEISGRGTWQSNPYVWVYEFELLN